MAFSDYRQRQPNFSWDMPPSLMCQRKSTALTLVAKVSLPQHYVGKALRLGVSLVLPDRTGTKTYWALEHVKNIPDFHASESFALAHFGR
jgi:hypothetical protein